MKVYILCRDNNIVEVHQHKEQVEELLKDINETIVKFDSYRKACRTVLELHDPKDFAKHFGDDPKKHEVEAIALLEKDIQILSKYYIVNCRGTTYNIKTFDLISNFT